MAYEKPSGKGCARARQAVKNGKRLKRHGPLRWMRKYPLMKFGPGGTDKAGSKNRGRAPRYSQRPADGNHGANFR